MPPPPHTHFEIISAGDLSTCAMYVYMYVVKGLALVSCQFLISPIYTWLAVAHQHQWSHTEIESIIVTLIALLVMRAC